jgi:hypothetical protein
MTGDLSRDWILYVLLAGVVGVIIYLVILVRKNEN